MTRDALISNPGWLVMLPLLRMPVSGTIQMAAEQDVRSTLLNFMSACVGCGRPMHLAHAESADSELSVSFTCDALACEILGHEIEALVTAEWLRTICPQQTRVF